MAGTPSAESPRRMTRRTFLRLAASGAVLAAGAACGEALLEPGRLGITRPVIPIDDLPADFDGTTIALLADIHHGPTVTLAFVEKAVEMTNRLRPDLIVLGGDYAYRSSEYLPPCAKALGALRAPMGVFFVLGNHDHWLRSWTARKGLRETGAIELINKGVWLERGTRRVLLAGVDDLWTGKPSLDQPFSMLGPSDICLLVSHNPDYAESVTDRRVRLVLSGHTHGGQVNLPGLGAPIVPSHYGQKYRAGLVKAPVTQVYITRGLGSIPPRIRFACPPEITLITLRRA